MVRRLPHFRIAHAQNQNSGILIVDATDITACRRPSSKTTRTLPSFLATVSTSCLS